MQALVVFESMFGNTEMIARAVAAGLEESMAVETVEVGQAPVAIPDTVDLLVVGGPTHAFSLSRPATRAQAVEQGATHGSPATGLREWLGRLPHGSSAVAVATFDSRVDKVRKLPGSAAKKAAKLVRGLGFTPAGRESFFVEDTRGPLLPGEVERARAWGRGLAAEATRRVA